MINYFKFTCAKEGMENNGRLSMFSVDVGRKKIIKYWGYTKQRSYKNAAPKFGGSQVPSQYQNHGVNYTSTWPK